MVAIRPIHTAKWAMWRIIQILPMPAICAAISCTDKKAYKFSAQENKEEISVTRALVLDRLAYNEKGEAPFLALFKQNIQERTARIGSIRESVMMVTSEVGKMANTVVTAMSPDSEAGEKLSDNEVQALMCAAEELEQQVARMKRAVINAKLRDK